MSERIVLSLLTWGIVALVTGCNDTNFSSSTATKRSTDLQNPAPPEKKAGDAVSLPDSEPSVETPPLVVAPSPQVALGELETSPPLEAAQLPTPPAPTPPAETPPPNQTPPMVMSCDNPQTVQIETEQVLNYPARQGCRFGTDGNLAKSQGVVTAVETSTATLNLPKGLICSMEIATVKADAVMKYDDFLSLTIGSDILFFSNSALASKLTKTSGVYQWDFAKLKGTTIADFASKSYCIAAAASCVFPATEQEGRVSIGLKPDILAPIALKLNTKPSVALNLNTLGDNDDTDCSHKDLSLKVKIRSLQPNP